MSARPTGKPREWTPEQDDTIREMYASGESGRAIARVVGGGASTIYRRMHTLGLEVAPSRLSFRDLAESQADLIVRLHERGLSPGKIELHVDGIKRQAVSGVLKRRGITPIRDKPGRRRNSLSQIRPQTAEQRAESDAEVCLTRCGRCGASRLDTLSAGREWHKDHPCGLLPASKPPALPPPDIPRRKLPSPAPRTMVEV